MKNVKLESLYVTMGLVSYLMGIIFEISRIA